MLAKRVAIDMSSKDRAETKLREAFSQLKAYHEEGAVLKADESKYNDPNLKWVKVSVIIASLN